MVEKYAEWMETGPELGRWKRRRLERMLAALVEDKRL